MVRINEANLTGLASKIHLEVNEMLVEGVFYACSGSGEVRTLVLRQRLRDPTCLFNFSKLTKSLF